MDLTATLQSIYDSEINVQIEWLWDGGIDVRLGDKLNGFLSETNMRQVADIVPWLQEAIAHFYPESEYARALPAEIREGAAQMLFLPPQTSARVTCPHCGAPHVNLGGMAEVIAFVCSHCGAGVRVEVGRVQ